VSAHGTHRPRRGRWARSCSTHRAAPSRCSPPFVPTHRGRGTVEHWDPGGEPSSRRPLLSPLRCTPRPPMHSRRSRPGRCATLWCSRWSTSWMAQRPREPPTRSTLRFLSLARALPSAGEPSHEPGEPLREQGDHGATVRRFLLPCPERAFWTGQAAVAIGGVPGILHECCPAALGSVMACRSRRSGAPSYQPSLRTPIQSRTHSQPSTSCTTGVWGSPRRPSPRSTRWYPVTHSTSDLSRYPNARSTRQRLCPTEGSSNCPPCASDGA